MELTDRIYLFGETGYYFSLENTDTSAFFFGIASEIEITERIIGMLEFGGLESKSTFDDRFFNIGTKIGLTDGISFIGSCGRSFIGKSRGGYDLAIFAGFQFLLDPRK